MKILFFSVSFIFYIQLAVSKRKIYEIIKKF